MIIFVLLVKFEFAAFFNPVFPDSRPPENLLLNHELPRVDLDKLRAR